MMESQSPLVSCLCITDSRVAFLSQAYSYYRSQTYSNLELVVVCIHSDHETVEYLREISLSDKSIRVIKLQRAEEHSLGEMRNISIEHAKGKYICVWDDDDIYHVDRVSRSLTCLMNSQKRAVVLSNVIMHDMATGRAYISVRRVWEQTLLCEKALISEVNARYAHVNSGEDTPFLDRLSHHIFPVFEPELYVYNIHGRNTSSSNHFECHFRVAFQLSEYQQNVISTIFKMEINIVEGSKKLSDKKFMTELPRLICKMTPHKT